jgi:uncharacterized membrane protein YfcA
MDPESIGWFVWLAAGAISLLAGLAHGILGLGFPMLATPLLAILVDIRTAVLLTLLPTVTVNLISILRGGGWGESIGRYWPLALMIPVGSVAGTWLLVSVDPAPFRLLLAAIILLHLASHRIRGAHLQWVRTYPWAAYLLFGLAAGFLAGTVNVMVPLLIIFALEIGMAPAVMVQVFNLCFLAGKTAQIVTFGYSGVLTFSLIAATLPLAAGAAATLFLGMRIRGRVDAETYRGWLRKVLVVIALVLIGQFVGWFWRA